jgi:hypothetical protein
MANMVSTPPINIFMADQHIAALEQEIFTLWSTKKNFNGVEISQPGPKSAPKANKLAQTDTPKTWEGSEPLSKPKPMEPPRSMSAQPPVHPLLMSAMHLTSLLTSSTLLLHQTSKGQGTDLSNPSPYPKSRSWWRFTINQWNCFW